MDLATDQTTMFYTSEGGRILRYDVGADAQLADFANIGGSNFFALRLLPPGDGSGGLLVADNADVKRLNGSGAVVQIYDAAGENNWLPLSLDPNGTSFWAGDFITTNFYRFNIATGAIEVGPIASGAAPFGLNGLCVLGEITAGVPPTVTPTPERRRPSVGGAINTGGRDAAERNRQRAAATPRIVPPSTGTGVAITSPSTGDAGLAP